MQLPTPIAMATVQSSPEDSVTSDPVQRHQSSCSQVDEIAVAITETGAYSKFFNILQLFQQQPNQITQTQVQTEPIVQQQ